MRYKINYRQIGGNRDKRIKKEFEMMSEDIKQTIITNSEFNYSYKDLNIVIPEGYPFSPPILTEISTNRSILLDRQYWWGPTRNILSIVKNYDTILKFGNRNLIIPSRNQEFVKWYAFKIMGNVNAKSFTQTKQFLLQNKCKIVINFDNNEKGIELVNLFISYTHLTRKSIVSYLFDNNSNIKYYICNNRSNVFFYDINLINKMLHLLKIAELYAENFSINDLLELSCEWITNTESFEYLLIHILFGSTMRCGWQSESIDPTLDMTIKENDPDRIKTLKLIYQIFLEDV